MNVEYTLLLPSPGEESRATEANEWVTERLGELADEYRRLFVGGLLMAKQQVRVCDICGALDGSEKGRVFEYAVKYGSDGSWRGDLCEEHAGPLTELKDRASAGFVPTGSRRHATFKVTSEEEIAAKKSTSDRGRKKRPG